MRVNRLFGSRIIQKKSSKNTDFFVILLHGIFICPKVGFHNSKDGGYLVIRAL